MSKKITDHKKPATMKDIAKKAGVSITTVSHVINKTRNVASETRELVLKTLAELHYQQPDNKQSRSQEMNLIGVITADIQEDYYIQLVKTIETIASENNISVLFCDSADDPQKEEQNIAMMLNRNVDGLIMAPANFSPYPSALRHADIPVVLVDRQFDGHNTTFVGIDNSGSAQHGVRYLVEKGCKKIAFVSYEEIVYTMQQRIAGYRLALMQALPDTTPMVLHLQYSKEDSHSLLCDFLDNNKPDGIICGTSDLCYQLLSVVDDMGINIPGDLKIITYDDNKWLDYLKHPISVITQPTVEIACQAVESLIQLGEQNRIDRRAHTEILFDVQIIDRLEN